MESVAFSTVTDPPSVGNPGSIDSYYYWNAMLPANKTGYHIIYSVWARSASTETFYGCSDVVLDGGNGQVTCIGATAPPPTTPCSATYEITTTWPGGFQGQGNRVEPYDVHDVLLDGQLSAGERRDHHQFLERDAVGGWVAGHDDQRLVEQRARPEAPAPYSSSWPTRLPAR
jgi:predicted carbohydrate-binding protein with CBM5 and CBM33 domain